MDSCLRQEETNMITAAQHNILRHYDDSCNNLTSIPNSCHVNICHLTYTQAFSHNFPVQTVCACYVHSPWLLVWVVIMLPDDLIHLFVEDEILDCRLSRECMLVADQCVLLQPHHQCVWDKHLKNRCFLQFMSLKIRS